MATAKLKIEVIKNKIYTNNQLWGKVWANKPLGLGEQLLNVLYYLKRDHKDFEIIIDGKNETKSFQNEVQKRYKDINNTELKTRFYNLANIEK